MNYYSEHACALFTRYSAVPFETVHASWRHLLPTHSALILDVGAGSGRDAAWLAQKGHQVIAIEPCPELLQLGRHHTPATVRWLNDSLPALTETNRLDLRFDVILLSGVWMHVPPTDRARALRKLSSLLRPGGILVISYRETPFEDGRTFFPIAPEELRAMAREFLLEVILEHEDPDRLNRSDVHWRTFVFRMPDDGTGALPLLRHVILNDAKSSTYKLALLRCLLRIADGYPGAATPRSDGTVSVPLGLVALVWVRLFKRLLLDASVPLPQQPEGNRGYGFVRAPFQALGPVSVYDLRPGQTFTGPFSSTLAAALRDAAGTIATMPAHFITFPNTDRQIFDARRARSPQRLAGPLDTTVLATFGEMLVPRPIWDAMRTHACWIEPALLTEWARRIAIYRDGSPDSWHDPRILSALQWLDPKHQTNEVRSLAAKLLSSGRSLYCAWTGRKLRDDFAIDHCLPFAIWPNNDLWNLVPANPVTNIQKNDRLVSAETLATAAPRIQGWWSHAYLQQSLSDRFLTEASVALPLVRSQSTGSLEERVFFGLEIQRTLLRRNQQLREWSPGKAIQL